MSATVQSLTGFPSNKQPFSETQFAHQVYNRMILVEGRGKELTTIPQGEQRSVSQRKNPDWDWPFWPLLPLYPYGQRRTVLREIVPDTIWVLEQIQGVLYVTVPIRMTVVKLQMGGLWVYAPVAPTPECIRWMNQLIDRHGPVKFIILPTVSGIEHKIFVGPFARYFPSAQVFVAPHQWSYPLNLPLSWLGLPSRRTTTLPANGQGIPFIDEFDYELLGPIELGLGCFLEAVFYHRPTHTLLTTDTIIAIPEEPPPVVQLDPYPLLFHARDHGLDLIIDSPSHRCKGWQRICLFANYFRPSAVDAVSLSTGWKQAQHGGDRSSKAYFGLFPFHWQSNWHESFLILHNQGRPFVAPILQTLILNRGVSTTLHWADRVAKWDFTQIIPCHFQAPVTSTPSIFREAFSFLESSSTQSMSNRGEIHQTDFACIQQIEAFLSAILPPREN